MTRDETFDRSRRLEWSLVVVRWAGAGLGAYLVTQSASSMEAAPPLHVKVVGESLIGLLAIGNVIVMAAIGRCRTARSLRILGAAAFGLDSVVVFGLIWSSSYTPSDTTWVVMYMLPLEGALRYGLPGALGLAGVGLASELGREGYLAARFAGYHYELGAVAFRAGIGSLVALVAGLMARGLAREAEHAKWEAGRSEEVARREAAARREANAFNSIILAGLAASELDESLQMMAVAIAFHLELDTFVILIREKDELVARALSGLPSKLLGERVVVGDGVTGWVAATRTPLLVDDVTTFHGYIQVDPSIRSELAVPIVLQGDLIGVLDVEQRRVGAFDEESLALLERLAGHIALVIQNARLRSQERHTLAKLKELDQLKSDFLAIANHELRTPLAAVRGFLRTLVTQRERLSPAEVDEFLERADRRSADLARLVDDLLTLSKAEQGALAVHREPTKLGSFLDAALEALPELARARIVAEAASPEAEIFIDSLGMGRVLRNLVDNALKFSPKETTVHVWVGAAKGAVELTVSDRGVGIPEDELPVIFERFRRGGVSLTRETEGVGLGLHIVKTLVEAMGGSVEVTSAPGNGSTFRVLVPARTGSPVAEQVAAV